MGDTRKGGKGAKLSVSDDDKLKKGEHPEEDIDLVDYLTKAQTSAVSPEMALERTNPKFNESRDYQMNCQRCVWAYELQRRGYDVEALPTFKGDDLPRGGNWTKLSKNRLEGDNMVSVAQSFGQTKSIKTELTNITETMNQWGDGSRGIVRVVWKGGRSGHVFNIENVGGKIIAYDGQTGKVRDLKQTLGNSIRNLTSMVRTDNADLDMTQISKYVKIRDKK